MGLLQQICSNLNVSVSSAISFARTAPRCYKVYQIPKRRSGTRTIAHPMPELKGYQRQAVSLLEDSLPIHDAAYAYRKNISIKDNAKRHARHSYLLKMDFANFFNSIDPKLFKNHLTNCGISLSQRDLDFLINIFFWCPARDLRTRKILSVGAPSSPFISNAVMFSFDKELDAFCKKKGITYTRYADDLTFSTNKKDILFSVPKVVEHALKNHSMSKISVNSSKTVFSSKAHNRHVTGVTISNTGRLSIGRERKRMISSLIHRYSLEQLDNDDTKYLQGILGFAKQIEPLFLGRMKRKYGANLVNSIIKFRSL